MKSLQTRIYEHEEVLYTLAWLSGCNINASPKKIINRSIQLDLIKVHNDTRWNANEKNISRRLISPRIIFPNPDNFKELTKILIGFGEISARSHGDFYDFFIKKFTQFFYKKSIEKILKYIVEKNKYLKRIRQLSEIGYYQKIGRTDFNWQGYEEAITELDFGSRISTYNYGISFVVKLCLKTIPSQYSLIVEKHKAKNFVGDLCCPVIGPLMFRSEQYIAPLLKSKNAYLRLLACASVVHQDRSDNQSSIDDNIQMLVSNGIDLGDAIWISSVKLKNHYQNVERDRENVISTSREIKRCEKDLNHCPKGIKPEEWIDSRKNALKYYEDSLINATNRLEKNFDDIRLNWPETGITSNQVANLIHLIRDEVLSRQLVDLVPSKDNQIQLLSHVLSSIEKRMGTSTQFSLEVCEETFLYSSERDSEKAVNAAKVLIQLSNLKGKIIGRFLGNIVGATVAHLEKFACRPFVSVRKPIQWHLATFRLAYIHLLAMCVFDEVRKDQEEQISAIVPIVIENVNFLLKARPSPFRPGIDELFRDLKRITAYIVASKDYTAESAVKIASDIGLPCDYRLRVIVSSKALIQEHSNMVLELFENFSYPPLHVDSEYKHFLEWLCLLDICIAYCWKYDLSQVAQEIIHIWEKYCPMYGDACGGYVVYAKKLYSALSEDGEDREWLKGLHGFDQSNCMNFLKEASEEIQAAII